VIEQTDSKLTIRAHFKNGVVTIPLQHFTEAERQVAQASVSLIGTKAHDIRITKGFELVFRLQTNGSSIKAERAGRNITQQITRFIRAAIAEFRQQASVQPDVGDPNS
jgi:hypothetical protein